MKITNKKSMAETQEVSLSAIDCREAIAHWLRTEHGLNVGRKDVTFQSFYDHDWDENVFDGATALSFKFVESDVKTVSDSTVEMAKTYNVPEDSFTTGV